MSDQLRPGDDPSKGGVRRDAGKLRWSLFHWTAAKVVLEVTEFGAGKYTPRNWEKGMDWSRVFDSLHRHLEKWWAGETYDQETGLPHLAHAAWNALSLLTYEIRGIGTDDRPSKPPASLSGKPTT